jgi:hypothetical protein
MKQFETGWEYDAENETWRPPKPSPPPAETPVVVGGPGATDHGALTGLGDDDHPQYHTAADIVGVATEVDLATHAGAADPHPGYLTPAEGAAAYDAIGAATAAVSTHAGLADPHPGYLTPAEGNAAYEVVGAVATHAGAADPHTGYQKESEKDAVNGYAGLDAGVRVPTARLGSGTADATTFLRGDQTWAVPAGGGAGQTDPVVWMGGF